MTITILREAPSFDGIQVRYSEQDVSAHISPSSDLIKHPGTLTIANECLYFYSQESSAGLAVPYPAIIIHATARESPYGPSIYCQLEGSLQSNNTSVANGSNHDNEEEQEEDPLLEIYFTPAQPSTLDTIYEHLSYCVSLHPDGDDEYDEDEDQDMYEDDEDDHEALYAEADHQGYMLPRANNNSGNALNAATSIGMTSTNEDGAAAATTTGEMPAIDLNSGEWYTGNPETDAKFELSEEGKANLDRMEKMLQDPHRLLRDDDIPSPDEEEPGQDAEEDRFKSPTPSS